MPPPVTLPPAVSPLSLMGSITALAGMDISSPLSLSASLSASLSSRYTTHTPSAPLRLSLHDVVTVLAISLLMATAIPTIPTVFRLPARVTEFLSGLVWSAIRFVINGSWVLTPARRLEQGPSASKATQLQYLSLGEEGAGFWVRVRFGI